MRVNAVAAAAGMKETETAEGADPQLWTVDEVTRFLNVPRSWIYAAAEAGRLPSFKVGRYVRFSPRAVFEWLEAQRGGTGQVVEPIPIKRAAR
jgi:excisionase family DNA binding protein